MKRKLSIPLLVLSLSLAGCFGNGGDSPPPSGRTADKDNSGGVQLGMVAGDFHDIGLHDLIDHFQQIDYTYTLTTPDKTEARHYGYSYVYQGTKTMAGITGEAILIQTAEHGKEFVYLFDSEGEIAKVFVDGDEVVVDDEDMFNFDYFYALGPYGFFTTPFVAVIARYHLPLVSDMHLKYVGWQLVRKDTTTRNLGAGSVPINIYEFTAGDEDSFYFEIAKIGGKNMYTVFRVNREDGSSADFEVTKLILR